MVTVRRGDVFWCELDLLQGSEIAGRRPCVVLQNDVGNRYSATTIVAAITTRFADRPYPFLAPLPQGTLSRPSAVNCAQIRAVDRSRLTGQPIAHLDDATLRSVDDALRASLGLR